MRFWRWDIMEIRNSSLNSPKMDRSHRRISWNIHEKFHHLEGLRVITSPRQVDAEAAMALQQGEFKWWWGTRCWWWLMVAAKLTSKNMTICDIYYRCFMIFHDLSFFYHQMFLGQARWEPWKQEDILCMWSCQVEVAKTPKNWSQLASAF